MEQENIKIIEDLSLNAWPSHQMELYDGWIIRFSYFYTHRTNSVEQFGTSTLPWSQKIPYCESLYRRWNTPTIFKISPLVSPDFDFMLENRGYVKEHITDVYTLSIDEANFNAPYAMVTLEDHVSAEWIQTLFTLKQTTNPDHLRVVPSMYAAIPKDTIAATISLDGRIVATGLGVLDRDYVGIYAIHVDEAYRRKGYAKALITAILQKASQKGASHAYLQVVHDNESAKKLYEKIGFRFFYQYFFRVLHE